jgi:hypothetical protein
MSSQPPLYWSASRRIGAQSDTAPLRALGDLADDDDIIFRGDCLPDDVGLASDRTAGVIVHAHRRRDAGAGLRDVPALLDLGLGLLLQIAHPGFRDAGGRRVGGGRLQQRQDRQDRHRQRPAKRS